MSRIKALYILDLLKHTVCLLGALGVHAHYVGDSSVYCYIFIIMRLIHHQDIYPQVVKAGCVRILEILPVLPVSVVQPFKLSLSS